MPETIQTLADLGGDSVNRLLEFDMDARCLRPYRVYNEKTRREDSYVDVFNASKGSFEPRLVQNSNATLRYDEWKTIDDALLMVARKRMKVVNILREEGLVVPISDGMASTILESEKINDIGDAELSMSPMYETEQDRPVYSREYLPLPIISKDFYLDARELASSRKRGQALDTTGVELATRKVAEMLEKLVCGTSGLTYTFGGGTVYGLEDYPYATTATVRDWSDTATPVTPAQIVDDVTTMLAASYVDNMYGPFALLVPRNFAARLQNDYTVSNVSTGITIFERLRRMDDIKRVEVVDYLSDSTVILLQLDRSTIRLADAMPVTPVQWEERGGWKRQFKVMTISVPQIRSDSSNRCGLVVGTLAS